MYLTYTVFLTFKITLYPQTVKSRHSYSDIDLIIFILYKHKDRQSDAHIYCNPCKEGSIKVITTFQIQQVGTKSLPKWMYLDVAHHILYGIPQLENFGQLCQLEMAAESPVPNKIINKKLISVSSFLHILKSTFLNKYKNYLYIAHRRCKTIRALVYLPGLTNSFFSLRKYIH